MNEAQPAALLVEDEPQIRRFLRGALEGEGWKIFEAGSVQAGLVDAAARSPDLIILDLGLPDGDGLDFLRDLRHWSAAPVIVLSARADEAEKVRALDAGADDYLTKPFGVAELLARVRSTLRRERLSVAGPGGAFRFGEVTVDLKARLVQRCGESVHMTPTEYRLLAELIKHAGRVVTNPQLLREVWGPGNSNQGHYLRIYMGHLRQKLEADPAQPCHLLTEVGVGYRLLQEAD